MKTAPVLAKTTLVLACVLGVAGWADVARAQPAAAQVASRPTTQIETLLKSPGRLIVKDEYPLATSRLGGGDADADPEADPEAGASGATRVRFHAIVVYERGKEDQRVRGLQINLERPSDVVTCYVDQQDLAGLSAAMGELSNLASRRERDTRRRDREGDDRRDRDRTREGDRAREDDRTREGERTREGDRVREGDRTREAAARRDRDANDRNRGRRPAQDSAREVRYSTADLEIIVRTATGRPSVFVQSPTVPGSLIDLTQEDPVELLRDWQDWLQEGQTLLNEK